MEELLEALEQAYADYRQDVEKFESRRRPGDGLFGFGHPLQQDACHERLDQRLEETVRAMAVLQPTPEEAERAVALLLFPAENPPWPLAAQWMLRAAERHALPMIPLLSPETALELERKYAGRYRPWDRLPAQKQVLKTLRDRAKEKGASV